LPGWEEVMPFQHIMDNPSYQPKCPSANMLNRLNRL